MTALFRALVGTEYGPPNNREALFPSVVGEHFVKNWSELISDHIRELAPLSTKPAESEG